MLGDPPLPPPVVVVPPALILSLKAQVCISTSSSTPKTVANNLSPTSIRSLPRSELIVPARIKASLRNAAWDNSRDWEELRNEGRDEVIDEPREESWDWAVRSFEVVDLDDLEAPFCWACVEERSVSDSGRGRGEEEEAWGPSCPPSFPKDANPLTSRTN